MPPRPGSKYTQKQTAIVSRAHQILVCALRSGFLQRWHLLLFLGLRNLVHTYVLLTEISLRLRNILDYTIYSDQYTQSLSLSHGKHEERECASSRQNVRSNFRASRHFAAFAEQRLSLYTNIVHFKQSQASLISQSLRGQNHVGHNAIMLRDKNFE